MSEHQHEKWQLLDSAQGGQYCGACGDHVQVIPEAAVEAAAKVLWDKELMAPWSSVPDGFKAPFRRDARAALEAAAPHMLAGAWDVAYAQGIEDERMSASSGTDYGPNRNNPYRSQA